ncbi:chorion protein S16 [Episyrphus balteatus]|uniref:chorion protein S16 n=1 Tax=Episyrphus balteatus TaxID=286459 RepID=UPI002486A655|nr:chorion protein S16 [Episyrphus balteatus]
MFKIFAVILVCAVCMSPVAEGAAASVAVEASPVQTLNPNLIEFYGYQVGVPLLTPDYGPLTSLLAASLPPRTYIGQSNPALTHTAAADFFNGESTIGIVAI